jgi:hypothetical protein
LEQVVARSLIQQPVQAHGTALRRARALPDPQFHTVHQPVLLDTMAVTVLVQLRPTAGTVRLVLPRRVADRIVAELRLDIHRVVVVLSVGAPRTVVEAAVSEVEAAPRMVAAQVAPVAAVTIETAAR